MPVPNSRQRQILSLLVEEGFGWLAADIVHDSGLPCSDVPEREVFQNGSLSQANELIFSPADASFRFTTTEEFSALLVRSFEILLSADKLNDRSIEILSEFVGGKASISLDMPEGVVEIGSRLGAGIPSANATLAELEEWLKEVDPDDTDESEDS